MRLSSLYIGVSSSSTAGGGAGPTLPPTASDVLISGSLVVSQVLTASYEYTDPQGLPESGSIRQWYRSDDAGGSNRTAISGATSLMYTLVDADHHKFLDFEVTPSNGVVNGSTVASVQTDEILKLNAFWANTVFQTNNAGKTNTSTDFSDMDETGRHTTTRRGTVAAFDTTVLLAGMPTVLQSGATAGGYTSPDNTDWDFTAQNNPFSVQVRVRPNGIGNRMFLCGQSDSGAAALNALFEINAAGRLVFWISSSNTLTQTTGTVLVNGNDYLLEASRSAAGVLKLFINGTEVASGTVNPVTVPRTEAYGFGNANLYNSLPFRGNLGPFRIISGAVLHTASYTDDGLSFPGEYY